MATGHLNPGYKSLISRYEKLRNVRGERKLDPEYAELNQLDCHHLDAIRQRARSVWMEQSQRATTYDEQYRDQGPRLFEPAEPRPFSPTRIHRPHPDECFLTTRLHHCPGWHNADTRLGKPAYQLDASVSPRQQAYREKLRSKYVAPHNPSVRPATADVSSPYCTGGQDGYSTPPALADQSPPRPHTGVPSLHRQGRYAGELERTVVGERNYAPYDDGSKTAYCYRKVARRDFTVHPEWTPNMIHHRLRGLSPPPQPPYCYYKPNSRYG